MTLLNSKMCSSTNLMLTRIMTVILATLFMAVGFAGCTPDEDAQVETTEETQAEETQDTVPETEETEATEETVEETVPELPDRAIMPHEPLVTDIYTADPSAHVFEDRLYIYTSRDQDKTFPADNEGGHYQMIDYRVLSIDDFEEGEVVDHGVILALEDIPWASQQLWAPDAAYKDGTYYLYFPAKDHDGIFRIGVATADNPAGPFEAEDNYIEGSFSMDPAVFIDDDGTAYMYIGGLWGGQLERWTTGEYDPDGQVPPGNEPAIGPYVAQMTDDMLSFETEPVEIQILDFNGDPVLTSNEDMWFFEGAWMHKYDGQYYLSYSTGTSHYIVYAVGDNPYGPFTYAGRILDPVIGWTTHHSIVEYEDQWYLFYHDSSLSGGVDNKRSVKYADIHRDEDGRIQLISPYA